jgi:hypothetical protein
VGGATPLSPCCDASAPSCPALLLRRRPDSKATLLPPRLTCAMLRLHQLLLLLLLLLHLLLHQLLHQLLHTCAATGGRGLLRTNQGISRRGDS